MEARDTTKQQLIAENEELRRRVAALQESEQRFGKYFHQDLIGMAAVTVDSRWLEYNDRLCEILGYRREELLHKTWKDLSHPDDLEMALTYFRRLVSGDIDRYTIEKRYIRKDGSSVYTTIAVQAFYREDGVIDCVIGLMEDISERRHAQEALEQERQSLWRMLQASDHERQTISYEIHDGLAQYLAAALMQFQAHYTPRRDSTDEATKAYETAVELVRQAHFESRRLISEVRPPVIDEIGLETAISHLVHEHRRREGPKIEYYSSVQFSRLPPILENALYRIVQEALTNACKHSKSEKLTVTMAQEGQDVRLEVQDWGIGFDPKSIEQGRFGLEGIRQRVRLFGGRLTMESTPGSGTLVRVVVPILEKPDHGTARIERA